MLEYIKKHIAPLLSCAYSLVVALFWVALRPNWSGISSFLNGGQDPPFLIMQLPLFICVLLWLTFAFSVFALLKLRGKLPVILPAAVSALFTAAIVVVIFFGAGDYLPFILPHFWRYLAFSAALIALAALICFPPRRRWLAWALPAAILALSLVHLVLPDRITYPPVVYAVEDDYQIVFSTSRDATAWVEVGGETYYDLYAGSLRSNTLVHKIVVPQAALDAARSYTIFAQTMIYRGPFGGYKGRVLSETRSFRPVTSADGLTYYAVSDIHDHWDLAIKTASYQSDMDFLVLAGDMTSMVDTVESVQAANYVAYGITKGEIPVIYARGNHEIKGAYAESLYRYVGSKDEKFYYTFRLGEVSGVVLDIGEDHDDDWWEYYGTAKFQLYQAEQTKLLRELQMDGKYHLVVCHVPIPFINARHNFEEVKTLWTDLLNGMDIDMCLAGHQHDVSVFEPGAVEPFTPLTYNANFSTPKAYKGCLTDFEFPGFMVSRDSDRQTGDAPVFGATGYTGLRVDVSAAEQTARFTNSKGETVPACNMFGTDQPRETFVFPRAANR